MKKEKHVKSFNETNIKEINYLKEQRDHRDHRLENIKAKISDASFSLKSFGTLTKTGAFVNGDMWAIHNLTEEEIRYFRENSDKDDFSFMGL